MISWIVGIFRRREKPLTIDQLQVYAEADDMARSGEYGLSEIFDHLAENLAELKKKNHKLLTSVSKELRERGRGEHSDSNDSN